MRILVHAHTTFSGDGELSPRELAALARRSGFRAVLVTDHFESLNPDSFRALCESCRSIGDCLMVPGYERSWKGYHVLALGANEWYDDAEIGDWALKVRRHGGIVVLAHPTRYRHQVPAPILEACDAVEVWNSKTAYDGSIGPHPSGYLLLNAARFPVCSQDLHGVRHLTRVGVELERDCSNSAQVLQCLRSGRYRMTNGLFRFGRVLPPYAGGMLGLVHLIRRRLVEAAISARRAARAYSRSGHGSASLRSLRSTCKH